VKLIHSPNALQAAGSKVCLAIGVFDGVHLGHQQIIRQTIADARQHEGLAVVVTFDCHPNRIVAPEHEPPLIYSLTQKLRTIESLGADALLLLHFDQELSQQNGEQFIRRLAVELQHVRSICVGADFVFGYRRSGNVELLRKLGAELRFQVHGMAAVALDGQPVSSTRIREVIRAGDLDAASQLLGRAYSFAGNIVAGDHLGQKLGFPTANVDTTGLLLPPYGVYAAHAQVGGQSYRAVLNIGCRPTLKQLNPQLRVEAHLLDFSGDLYGREMEVVPFEKVREEKRFPSLEALRDQIAADVRAARACF
jgi:riboflavin kinase / FMN adenylyltransferase